VDATIWRLGFDAAGSGVASRANFGGTCTTTFLASQSDGYRTQANVYTLTCIREVRAKVDRSELVTVQKAREIGITWTEIATALGVTRQAAWGTSARDGRGRPHSQ
jgi:hypothetical protein